MSAENRILVVGVGGLGVPAVLALARAGVRRVGLIDPDPVELSNLPRQVIFSEADVGRMKVDAAAARLSAAFAGFEAETYAAAFDSGNAAALVARFGVIIDATDNPHTKFLINDACVAAGRPFVYAGVIGLVGQAMTVVPGRTACLRCLFEEEPDQSEVASCREAGILGPVAAAMGEIEAAEALRLSRGEEARLAGKIITYDASKGPRLRVVPVARRAACGCATAGSRAAAEGAAEAQG